MVWFYSHQEISLGVTLRRGRRIVTLRKVFVNFMRGYSCRKVTPRLKKFPDAGSALEGFDGNNPEKFLPLALTLRESVGTGLGAFEFLDLVVILELVQIFT